MKKVGITACSDGQKTEYREQNDRLVSLLESMGIKTVMSDCIYEKTGSISGSGKERADCLMKMYTDPEIEEIYDISGGDMANQLLDYLDYDRIASSGAVFWGYSDLTVILNAIYAMTGKKSVLWQVKNMVIGEYTKLQQSRFQNREELFRQEFSFVQGSSMKGIVIGGNIRCFLKLAGTKYMPDLADKILLLEAMGGEVPQMLTYLSQLEQLAAFDKVKGILLGTFSRMEEKECIPDMISLVKEYAGDKIPIAKTSEIGHGRDAKAIVIGQEIELSK